MENENKLILKFEFISDLKVRVTLVYIDENVLYTYKKSNYNYCYNKNYSFHITSRGKFCFNKSYLQLPDYKYMKENEGENISSKCLFLDDETARKTLKRLYTTLNKWANQIDKEDKPNRVVVQNEYWFVK